MYKNPKGETTDIVRRGFDKLKEKDSAAFDTWLEEYSVVIRSVIDATLTAAWQQYESAERRVHVEALRAEVARREGECVALVCFLLGAFVVVCV